MKQKAGMERRVERGRVGEGEGGGEGEWGRGRMGKRESNELLGWEGSVINN